MYKNKFLNMIKEELDLFDPILKSKGKATVDKEVHMDISKIKPIIDITQVRQRRATKEVVQYTKTGKPLKLYSSADVAAESINTKGSKAVVTSCIRGCCRGKSRTAYGYQWRYLENAEQEIEKA